MKSLILLSLFGLVACHHGGSDREDNNHGGFGGLAFLFPPFLKGLSKDQIQAYFAIYKDNSTTIATQNQEALTWAEPLNITDTVREYQTNISNFKTAMAKNLSDILTQLPGVLTELSQIFTNDQQTREQQKEAFENLKNTSGIAVRILMAIPMIAHKGNRDHGDDGDHEMMHHGGPMMGGHHGGPMMGGGMGGIMMGHQGGMTGGPMAGHFGMGSSGGATFMGGVAGANSAAASNMMPMIKKAPVQAQTSRAPKKAPAKKNKKNNKNNNTNTTA